MYVNLRNSGFEQGNISFWDGLIANTLEIESTDVLIGAYSGKVTTGAVTKTANVRHKDSIPVEYGNVVGVSLWVKGVAGDTMILIVRGYDKDRGYYSQENVKDIVLSGSWEKIESQCIVEAGIAYLEVGINITSSLASAVNYIDNLSVYVVNYSELGIQKVEVASLTNKTASGDTTADKYRMYGFRNYYAEIDVTAMTGTSPTCDVTICEIDQFDNERVLGTFTRITAATDQRVGIAAPIGKGMYVKYVMGGTVTDCDFEVAVIGVR